LRELFFILGFTTTEFNREFLKFICFDITHGCLKIFSSWSLKEAFVCNKAKKIKIFKNYYNTKL